ncbi:MAG TPA: SAM-dependent methyltransferase [Wenzhouxiangellaceae bacterium]|nr:SAM-dependent methyltransferase [Wenzhouxiangellaceae bacterium]
MSNPSLKLPEPPAELAELSRELCTRIVNAIDADGPMPFQRYMAMALYEPGLGYYVNGLHKFGAAGDFVTAPEHGRLFAMALARQLDPLGSELGPDWTVLELGPGSGALARDVLLQQQNPPAKYLLLEPSAPLRDVQRETLSVLPDDLLRRVEWVAAPPTERFDGAVIANEVIDALPVARFRIGETGIEEARVTVEAGRLAWDCAPAEGRVLRAVDQAFSDLPHPHRVGYASEVCVDLPEWLNAVTAALNRGIALIIDYGYPRREYYHPDRNDGTLVCHYRHRAHFDPFAWPGLTDLSAFVDFTAVAEAAQQCGLEIAGFTNQAGFVLGSGIGDVLGQVADAGGDESDDQRQQLMLSGEFKRLVLPGEMGEKFKVMALVRDLDGSLDWTPEAFALSDQLDRL